MAHKLDKQAKDRSIQVLRGVIELLEDEHIGLVEDYGLENIGDSLAIATDEVQSALDELKKVAVDED